MKAGGGGLRGGWRSCDSQGELLVEGGVAGVTDHLRLASSPSRLVRSQAELQQAHSHRLSSHIIVGNKSRAAD